MFYKAKNCSIKIDDTTMDYITFGRGNKNLIIIPGLGDALKSVKGSALPFAIMYKIFAKDYKVYVFSRKNKLNEGYSTLDMAIDLKRTIKMLKIEKASVLGVSQGGMIAQHLFLNYPSLVEKLVLAVTLSKPNETSITTISNWINLAEKNDFNTLFIDTAKKTYSEKRLKLYKPFYPILCKFSKPKSLDNFIIQANACLNHNSYDEIEKINCPTLIIGGDCDKIVGSQASKEINDKIKGSKLKIYPNLGHGLYEEAKDFNSLVLEFLNL